MAYLTAPPASQLIYEPEDTALSALFVGKNIAGDDASKNPNDTQPQHVAQQQYAAQALQRSDTQPRQNTVQPSQDIAEALQNAAETERDEPMLDAPTLKEPKQAPLYGGNYIKIEYGAPKRETPGKQRYIPAIDKRKTVKIIVIAIVLIVLFTAVYSVYSYRKRVKSMDVFDRLSGGIRNVSDQSVDVQERSSGIPADNNFLAHNMKHVDLKKINNAKNDIIQFIMNSKPIKSAPATMNMIEQAKKYDRNIVRIDDASAISRMNNFICGPDESSVFIHRDSYRVEVWNPTSWGATPEDRMFHLGLVAILRPILNYSETKHVISKLISNPEKLRVLREHFSG